MILSIIIPAFNAQATISRCLDSVYCLPVSEDEFEVIVIDDCSTDSTVDIVRTYEQVHDNLVFLFQPVNSRQGAARNRGLRVAKGKYICFLDSDDEIRHGVLSAINLAERNSLELTIMRSVKVSLDGEITYNYILPYDSNDVFSGISFQCNHPFWCTGPVLYVYLKSFLESVNYPFAENVLFEDSDFVNVHLFHAKRMGYCNSIGYQVCNNPLSTTHSISFRHVSDYAILGTRMLSFYQQLEDKKSSFSYSILEGGSFNIMRSCKNLFKLNSLSDVRSFYTRLDSFVDRRGLLSYSEPAYCWNRWTRFCLKHKRCTILIVGGILLINRVPFVRSIKKTMD
jgi:glycosyltransferase involved in cell wall biosynthesis